MNPQEPVQEPLEDVQDAGAPPSMPNDQPPVFDPVAFETQLKSIGPDWTLTNFTTKAKRLHQSNSDLGRKYSEVEKEANRFKPLSEAMRDDRFTDHMRQSMNAYFEQNAGAGYVPQGLSDTLDPMRQEVQETKIALRTMQIERDLDRLEGSGFDIKDPDRREALADKMINTGLNARDSYMILFGEEDMRNREQSAVTKTAQTIRKNNASYTPLGSRTVAPQAPKLDPRTMTEQQAIAKTEEILARMRGESG
jgi:hypothetical protein